MNYQNEERNTTIIEQKKMVWVALADVFLDTDVSLTYDAISKQCALSCFSIEELEHMLKNEVAPICCDNLMCVAGQWAGFDEEWLITNITDKINTKTPVLTKLWQWVSVKAHQSYINQHWKNIVPLIVLHRTQNSDS